jgi:hypothetical protein
MGQWTDELGRHVIGGKGRRAPRSKKGLNWDSVKTVSDTKNTSFAHLAVDLVDGLSTLLLTFTITN